MTTVAPLEWMLEVAVLLASAKFAEALFMRLGLPRVIGYIVVGMIASALGYEMSHVTKAFAIVGVTTMLFYAGLESSTREFLRGLRNAGLVAIGGVVGSILCGFLAGLVLELSHMESLAIGITLLATSVSLTVKTLEELNKLGTREAQAIIGAAVVDDVIGLALLSILTRIARGSLSIIEIAEISSLAFAFWLAVSLVFQAISKSLFRFASRVGSEAILLVIPFSILMLFSYVAAYIRLSSILLAYALGLGIASFRYFARRLSKEIYPLVALFTPLFFVYAGSLIDLSELCTVGLHQHLKSIAVITVVALLSKILGCGLAAKLLKFTTHESLIIGIGMAPRAEVMMTAAIIGYELGVLSPSTYLGLLMVIPVSSIAAPTMLKYLYTHGRMS